MLSIENTPPFILLHARLIGVRNVLLLPIGFLTIVLVFALGTYGSMFDRNLGSFSSAWLGLLTALQALVLTILAPGAIRRCVLRDFQTGMIESHRLAPVGPLRLVTAYMTGPPLQMFLLYLAMLIAGSVFALLRAQSIGVGLTGVALVSGWYMLQVMLLTLSFPVAALSLLSALATRGKANVAGILIAISVFGGWFGVYLVPGIALITGATLGEILIDVLLRRGGPAADEVSVTVLYTLATQFTLGALLIWAACRIVRVPERPVFSIRVGLALLVFTALVLILGITQTLPNAAPFGGPVLSSEVHLTASMLVFLGVAYFVLHALTHERVQLDWAARLGEAPPASRTLALNALPLLLATMGLSAALSMNALALSATPVWEMPYVLLAAIVLVLHFVTDYFMLYAMRLAGVRSLVLLGVYVLLTKGSGPLVDFLRLAVREVDPRPADFTLFTTSSPVGALAMCFWGASPRLILQGLLPQVGLAALALLLASAAARRRVRILSETTPAQPLGLGRAVTVRRSALPRDGSAH